MKKFLKINILLFVLLMLSACMAAEYFIKRAINDFEGNIVEELSSLADFNSEQQETIKILAANMDQWMRVERLPIAQTSLLTLAKDIEENGQIKSSHWSVIVNYLQQGLQTSESPLLITQYSEFALSLTEEQVEQMSASIDEELQDWLLKSKDRTINKQNDRIVDALKWVFRAIGQPLTRVQKKYATEFLVNRKVDLEFQREIRINETNQFIKIMVEAKTIGEAQLNKDIKAYLFQVENGRAVPNQEDWLFNRDLFLELLNDLIGDLNEKQRQDTARKIREYEVIFDELAKVE